MGPPQNLIAAKPKNRSKALLNLLSQLPLMSLTDADKHIRLINRRMERKGISLCRVDIFKWLLRNKVKTANSTMFTPSKLRIVAFPSCL